MSEPEIHQLYFEMNRMNGVHRAICCCGWEWYGTRDEVRTRAAGHDLDAARAHAALRDEEDAA